MSAPAVSSPDDALQLLADTLNAVEDELSGVPFNPKNWKTDGRMYPPEEDSRMKNPECPILRRYRNRAHNTLVGPNGSIRIKTRDGGIFLDKAGADGLSIGDLTTKTAP